MADIKETVEGVILTLVTGKPLNELIVKAVEAGLTVVFEHRDEHPEAVLVRVEDIDKVTRERKIAQYYVDTQAIGAVQ